MQHDSYRWWFLDGPVELNGQGEMLYSMLGPMMTRQVLALLDQAVEVAREAGDVARARLLRALVNRRNFSPAGRGLEQVPADFRAALHVETLRFDEVPQPVLTFAEEPTA